MGSGVERAAPGRSAVLCAEHGIPMWRDEEDEFYRCVESQRGCDITYPGGVLLSRGRDKKQQHTREERR